MTSACLARPASLAPVERAITLWRPFSHAITHGTKRLENRGWHPSARHIGTRIAIHAGRRWHESEWWPDGYSPPSEAECPIGVVGTARLVGWLDLREPRAGAVVAGSIPAARLVRSDPWWVGPVGWCLADVVAFKEPIDCVGMQGLWKMPPPLLEAVRRAEYEAHR